MRVYMDWEFLEDGVTIKPISVGMVREDGQELYYEFAEAPYREIENHAWLMENVMPHMLLNEKTFLPTYIIKEKVNDFLLEALTLDGTLELWGWYSAYDHVCLAQLFGRMIDLPEWCPMYTNDVRQEFNRLGNPTYPHRQVNGLHNALEDAKFLKAKHEWLMTYSSATKLFGNKGVQLGNGNSQVNTF